METIGSEELARAISPLHNLTESLPPTIVFFGTEDWLLREAEAFMERARQLGLVAELYTARGENHGFFNRSPWRERTLYLADRFLVQHRYLTGEPSIEVNPGALR